MEQSSDEPSSNVSKQHDARWVRMRKRNTGAWLHAAAAACMRSAHIHTHAPPTSHSSQQSRVTRGRRRNVLRLQLACRDNAGGKAALQGWARVRTRNTGACSSAALYVSARAVARHQPAVARACTAATTHCYRLLLAGQHAEAVTLLRGCHSICRIWMVELLIRAPEQGAAPVNRSNLLWST